MTIEADVEIIAKHWGLDPALVQAVVTAEGNILKAVQCSIPTVTTRDEALTVLCRSLTHRMCDYIKDGSTGMRAGFLRYFGSRWAPVGAANDPTALNANFVPNVTKLWTA